MQVDRQHYWCCLWPMHGTEVKVRLVIMLQAGFEPANELLEGKLELRELLGLKEMN